MLRLKSFTDQVKQVEQKCVWAPHQSQNSHKMPNCLLCQISSMVFILLAVRAEPPDQLVPHPRALDNILSQLMALGKAEGGRKIQECQQLRNQLRGFPKLCLCRARKHDFLSFLDKSFVPMRNRMEGWVLTSSQWAVSSLFIRHGVQLRSGNRIT